MRNFVILALLGFAAQLVDGALGMAYGATSSTLLVGVAGLRQRGLVKDRVAGHTGRNRSVPRGGGVGRDLGGGGRAVGRRLSLQPRRVRSGSFLV